MTTTFFWVPGTGESYKDDVRTFDEAIADGIAAGKPTMGASVIAGFGPDIESVWVGYDSSFGPVSDDPLNGESHHDSRAIGRAALLAKARATEGWLIFGGYSQGAGVVWEVMQEVYQGKHPDLWPRIIGSMNMANPYRTKTSNENTVNLFTTGETALPTSGWGVANRLGTGLEPRIFELNLINVKDMICNAQPDSWLRDVADLVEFMELGKDSEWGIRTFESVSNVDWVAAAAGWLDVPNQMRRLANTLIELMGYMNPNANKHTSYGNAARFPYTRPDGTKTSLATYAGEVLAWNVPYLIAAAENRGPVPPVVSHEDFTYAGPGWTGFSGGNLSGARMDNNRAGQIASSGNQTVNTYGIYKAVAPADDYAIDVLLAAPLQGSLDTGTNGSAAYFRVRSTATWAVGTSVEFRLRASGSVAISTVSGGTVTQKATATGSFTYGHKLRFQAKGNVYSVINLTTNTVILTWTDASGIVNTGPNNRRSTAGQTSNNPLFQPQWSCYAFDSFAITDLSV